MQLPYRKALQVEPLLRMPEMARLAVVF